MGKVDDYISALQELGDGRYRYYDGGPNSVGCSEYTRQALVKAGVIKPNESFHAASGVLGPLNDPTRFQKIPWDPSNLQKGDIMWSNGHHVATWDGVNGVYEAAPEKTHGICSNGKTGVGHWPKHTYYNCGTGTNNWTCLYRIIDSTGLRKSAKEITMDSSVHIKILIEYLPDVKSGSTGEIVKAVQKILRRYGWYSGEIDGHAGPLTVEGIKLLRIALGLTPDGWIGPITWSKILGI